MPTNTFQINLQTIPSPPSVAISLLELFKDPDAGLDDLAHIIRIDSALSARLIAHCNSAAMGMPRKVDSVERACVCLGMNAVRMIALSFSLVEIDDDSNFDFSRFWNKSLAFAVSAQAICQWSNHDADYGFLAGLMINVGELAIYRDCNREAYSESMATGQTIESIVEFENKRLGFNRFNVASEFLTEWSFPQEIPETLRRLAIERPGRGSLDMSIACGWNLASLLIDDSQTAEQIGILKTGLTTNLDIDDETLETLFRAAQDNWREYSSMLNMKYEGSTRSIREIENAARIQMTSFSMMQVQDQQRIEKENDQLRSSATKDSLTGINNRRAYDEQGAQLLSQCLRNDSPISVVIVDIDHFKKFNDNFGHQVGDQALRHVANSLGQCLRNYDNLYRYGGEEFVVVLPNNNREQAMRVAERLRAAISDSPLKTASTDLPMSISVGVVTCEPTSSTTLEQLFEKADACLYLAKKQGRNCCVAFVPES